MGHDMQDRWQVQAGIHLYQKKFNFILTIMRGETAAASTQLELGEVLEEV